VTAIPSWQDESQVRNAFGRTSAQHILVFVNDPETLQAGDLTGPLGTFAKRQQSLYDLTLTEAVVALRIAQGNGLPAIALTLGLAQSTVRSHAKHIFSKMQVHSQVQLTRLIDALGMVATR